MPSDAPEPLTTPSSNDGRLAAEALPQDPDPAKRREVEQFRLLVDNIGDYAIYMLDPQGRVTTWNSGAERLKGYSAHEIIGKNFAAFFPPEDIAAGKPRRELDTARVSGRFEDEGWRLKKDGTRFWANAILTAVQDERGVLVGFAKITRDLTTRRKAEEKERALLRERTAREVAVREEHKLRDSEERFRALSNRLEIVLEGVADGITVQDSSGRVVFANTAAAHLCGFDSVEALLAATSADIVADFTLLDEEGRPFNPELLPGRRVMAGERSASALVQVRDKRRGRDWWSLIRAGAVLGSDGTPELAVNIWHDVTTEHRAKRDARYLADAGIAFSAANDAQALLNAFARALVPGLADWVVISVREREGLRSAASYHADPVKRLSLADYHRQFPNHPALPGLENVMSSGVAKLLNDIALDASGSPDSAQRALLTAVGARAAAVAPIALGSRVLGVIALVIGENHRHFDASQLELLVELGRRAGTALERTELFRASKVAAEAAERASRLKDEFLTTVSHELRTPLNAILGWSAILKDRVTEPKLLKPIQSIHRNAQAQVRIIDDILDVSRVVTGKFRIVATPVDLLEIAEQAVDVLRPTAVAKGVSLSVASARKNCFLVADAERLQQVLWNLLSNAVKFTPAGGDVLLSVEQDGSHAVVRVKDTGRGIDPRFLPYVFDRFSQADSSSTRRFGGLGLGLALVRHIIELHGGTVHAASEGLDRGATFRIELPIQAVQPTPADPSQERPLPQPPMTDISLTDIRILVVDDELDAREVIAEVLEDAGARVASAGSSSEGVAVLERFTPQVILSDIAMPGEDGVTFLRRVRGLPQTKDVPVLAFTAYAGDADRTRLLAAGFTGHIAKPVDPDGLLRAVKSILEKRDAAT